jgi:hypothetical protein
MVDAGFVLFTASFSEFYILLSSEIDLYYIYIFP